MQEFQLIFKARLILVGGIAGWRVQGAPPCGSSQGAKEIRGQCLGGD